MMLRYFTVALYAATLAFAPPTRAALVEITTIPANWRLEDYMDGAITLWFTGSSCTNGKIYIPASASAEVKERFWSLILTAKSANKAVGIYYDNASANCNVTNFFYKEQ